MQAGGKILWAKILLLYKGQNIQGQSDGEKKNNNTILCKGCIPIMEVKNNNKLICEDLYLNDGA
jgi:hypothetical protein